MPWAVACLRAVCFRINALVGKAWHPGFWDWTIGMTLYPDILKSDPAGAVVSVNQ